MSFPTDSLDEFIIWLIGLVIIYTVMYILIGGGVSFIFWLTSMCGMIR